MAHIYTDIERPNSKIKRKPNNRHVNAFISDAREQLLRKKSVWVYDKSQLEELKLEFGDELLYKYNDRNNYWLCYLKEEDEQ